jgi:hypothetical protein
MSEQIERATVIDYTELARRIRVLAIGAPNTNALSTDFGNWFAPRVEKMIASVVAPIVMRSLPSREEVEGAIKRIGKESTAPDKDCPLWLETDIRAGMEWMFERIVGSPLARQ